MKLKPSRIYALGPEGTFSDQAARHLRMRLEDPKLAIEYTRTIPEVLGRTEADARALGVFPVENSVAGTVGQAQDGMTQHRLTILWEINIQVRFSLLTATPLDKVERYFAHPQAFDQCSGYLATNLPRGEVVFTNSNTESGNRLLEEPKDSPVAAIVPIEYGTSHPKLLVAEDIQDYPNNTTRFLVARRSSADETPDFTRQKTSLLVEPMEDYPGLLYEMLSIFQSHGLNLCRLESRPAKTTPWAYVFHIDFNNSPNSTACLEELRTTRNRISVLGSYDLLE